MTTQTSLWSTKDRMYFRKLEVMPPGPGEVLIKNVCVASNPKDWKTVQLWGRTPSVEGNDVAGFVEAVGEGVHEFKPGDRVAAFTKMRQDDPKWGAYQEYSTAMALNTFPLAPSISFERAATLPLALGTALVGLYARLRLPLPPAPKGEQAVLIWGASSSVGAYAVQLASMSGLYVVGIAGSGAEYAREMGAGAIVDYRGKSMAQIGEDVRRVLGGRKLGHIFDIVSSHDSIRLCIDLLRTGGGRFTYVLHLPEDLDIPDNVEVERTGVRSAYGEDMGFVGKMYRQVARLVADDTFHPNNVKVLPGGLSAVPEGLEMLKAGHVHSEKLVYRVAETPWASLQVEE